MHRRPGSGNGTSETRKGLARPSGVDYLASGDEVVRCMFWLRPDRRSLAPLYSTLTGISVDAVVRLKDDEALGLCSATGTARCWQWRKR